jgi:hypothetical protein
MGNNGNRGLDQGKGTMVEERIELAKTVSSGCDMYTGIGAV